MRLIQSCISFPEENWYKFLLFNYFLGLFLLCHFVEGICPISILKVCSADQGLGNRQHFLFIIYTVKIEKKNE